MTIQHFYKKDLALQKLTPDTALFQQDKSLTGGKSFLIGNFGEFWEYSKENPWLYETFTAERPVKFCFDFDCEEKILYKQHLDYILTNLVKKWNQLFPNNNICTADFMLLKTKDQPNKVSIHGILQKYSLFSIKTCKAFVCRLFEDQKIKDNFKKFGFDDCIYRYGAFRLLNSSKLGKKYPLLLWNRQIDTLKHCNDYNIWLKSLATYTVNLEVLNLQYSIKPKVVKTPEIDTKDLPLPETVINWLMYCLDEEYYNDYNKWISVGLSLKSYITCNNISEEGGSMLFDAFSKRSIHNYNDDATEIFLRLPVPKELTWKSLVYWVQQSILKKNKERLCNDKTINKRYISAEDITFSQTHVNMCPGSGKTTCMADILMDKQCIILTYRITLASQIKKTLQSKGIKDVESYTITKNKEGKAYFDSMKRFNSAQIRIVQIDSIEKLDFDNINENTLVYIDETSAFLDYMISSPTLTGKYKRIHNAFSNLLYSTGNFYSTDADTKEYHLNFLKVFKPDIKIIGNTYKIKKETEACIVYDNEEETLKEVINCINNKENIVVASDSKTLCERIKYSIKDHENIKVYTADEGNTKDIEDGVNITWKGYTVIYSPKILTGVDNNIPSKVFGFFSGRSIDYKGMVQMLERTRNKTKLVISVTATNRTPTYYNQQHVKEVLQKRLKGNCKLFEKFETCLRFDEKGKVVLSTDPYSNLFIDSRYNRDLSKALPREMLEYLLKERGYKINNAYECVTKEEVKIVDNKEMKKLKKIDNEDIRQQIISGKYKKKDKPKIEELNRRSNFMNLDIVEEAKDKSIGWELLNDRDGVGIYIKNKFIIKTQDELDTKMDESVQANGNFYAIDSYAAKAKSILMIEKELDIKNRYDIQPDILYNNKKKTITLDNNFIFNTKKLFGIKDTELGTSWYGVYMILIKCWKKYFGKDIITTKRNREVINKERISVTVPIWNHKKIQIIQNL